MLGAASTYEGINTNFLYIGSRGSHFSCHVEDSLLQSTSYLQKGSNKFWFFFPAPERPRAERVMREHMDPAVLAAAGGDVWEVLAVKECLWPETHFLAHGVRVGFHRMETGDFVVTGYGVLHSGFNGGPNIASAVNLACTGWLSYAIEHSANWRTKPTIHIPFEKLLVLAAQKLADGEWCCGDAKTFESWEPEELKRDVVVMVTYLEKYLNAVLDFMDMDSQPGWRSKKPTAVALESASRAVQQFIVENAIQPDGEPLELPNEIK